MTYEGGTIFPTNGVPQGSLISPLLFNIALNNFIKDGQILGFADDMVAIVRTQNEFDNLLQRLHTLSVATNLNWNKDKTKVMAINWSKFNSRGVELVESYKYLGYQLSTTLKNKPAIDETVTKSCKLIGIFASKIINLPFVVRRILTCAYIRSIFEYILPPMILCQCINLKQAVQIERVAIKKYLSLPKNSSNESILLLTGFDLIEYLYLRVISIHKKISCNSNKWVISRNSTAMSKAVSKIQEERRTLTESPTYQQFKSFTEKRIQIGKK
jgi:hypothetical protein